MGLKIFGKAATTTLVLTASLQALVGAETVTAEQVDAANQDLDAAGIKGAQLVPSGFLDELTTKADRTDAAETAHKATTDALAAAGVDSIAALVKQRDDANAEVERLEALPGAKQTNPVRQNAAASEVEETTEEKEATATINNLGHNKALAGHPLFG